MSVAQSNDGKSGSSIPVFVTALVVILIFLVLPRIFKSKHPLEGTMAPAWSLDLAANANPVDAPAHQLSLAQLQGKVVVLDFWATWCGPCKEEAPILDRFAKKHPEGVVVVGIDTDEAPGAGGAWAKRNGIGYPIVYDASSQVGHTYRVRQLPTLVVVDRGGKIAAVRVGVTHESEPEEIIANIK